MAVGQSVLQAVDTVDSLPGDVELARDLPWISGGFSVIVHGSWHENSQLVNVVVESKGVQVSSVLLLSSRLNGGDFELSCQNPEQARVVRNDDLWLEMV